MIKISLVSHHKNIIPIPECLVSMEMEPFKLVTHGKCILHCILSFFFALISVNVLQISYLPWHL